MPFSEQQFRIPRTVLARLAAEQYVRSFWWFIIIPPVFGIVCLFSGSQVLYGLGMLGILWPASVPIRAVFISARAGKYFSKPVSVTLRDHTLFFVTPDGNGTKLSLASVRRIQPRHGYMIFSYGIGAFAAVPESHLPPLDQLIELANEARTPTGQVSVDAS